MNENWFELKRPRQIDHNALKTKLISQRDKLEELKAASAKDSDPVELDQSRIGRVSRMDAMQLQAMSIETARRREVQLQRIETALQRFKDDIFGDCLHCGEAIEPKRLEIDPAISLCIECAEANQKGYN